MSSAKSEEDRRTYTDLLYCRRRSWRKPTHGVSTQVRAVQYGRKVFSKLEPRTGAGVQFKTILMVFPGVRTEDAPSVIDAVQAKLKPSFVHDHHLMIGEFHELNMTEAVGFPGKNIFPNRSPVPMLAIRVIVIQDFPKFLKPDIRPGHEQEDFLLMVRNQCAYYDALLLWAPPGQDPARRRELWQAKLAESRQLLAELLEVG